MCVAYVIRVVRVPIAFHPVHVMRVIMERDIGASAAAPRQRRVIYLYLRRGSGRPRSAFISVRRRASIQNRCARARHRVRRRRRR